MTDFLCQQVTGGVSTSATVPAVGDRAGRRLRKDPTRISAQEYLILRRMKRIDRGQGCHAAVERIGRSYDDLHQSFSPAQTRRHIRRLRELGEICFAGQTPDGRNVYLFPERTYVREDVPVDLGRPVDHLRSLPSGASWSTEKAAQILKLSERGEVATRTTMVDEYPVNRQILKSYSDLTIRRAIGRLKAANIKNIQSPAALLRYFISLEIQDQKKRQAVAAAALKPAPPVGPRMPIDAEKEVLALLREGRAAEAHQLAAKWADGAMAEAPVSDRAMPAARQAHAGAVLGEASVSTAVTIAKIVGHYLEAKKPTDGSAARSFHGQKAASLIRLLGSFRVRELTQAELTIYQRKRRADHVCERTIREEFRVLRQALELGVRSGLIAREDTDGLDTHSGRAGPKRKGQSAAEGMPCR